MKTRTILTLGLWAALLGAAPAQVVQRPQLTLQGARQVAQAAVTYAKEHQAPGAAIAVVDQGGSLLYLERLDGTFAMASTVSIGKARTAALFQKPTRVFEQIINEKGRHSMTALPDFTPLQGGVPILVDGQLVGAVGVSGAASAQQDDDIAIAAAAVRLGADCCTGVEPGPVTHLERPAVEAAFQKGVPLLEVPEYKIHASRREAAGLAEVHLDETDVIHVLQGSASFVTGGAVVEPQKTAPHEIRGKAIEGGTTRTIRQGDVLVVPRGTPHWFQQVDGPLLYYVVKVIHPCACQ